MPSDPRPMTCYLCSIVTLALSRPETLFFSRWPWSDLSRSLKVKLIVPSDPRPMTCYLCSIVTIALSRPETPVFQQMTLIWPFKVTKGQTDYAIRSATHDLLFVFYTNYSAISHGNPVLQQMTLIWPFRVTKGQSDYAIRFATHDSLFLFYSNFSAISHGNPVFQQMTLIWPLLVFHLRRFFSTNTWLKI